MKFCCVSTIPVRLLITLNFLMGYFLSAQINIPFEPLSHQFRLPDPPVVELTPPDVNKAREEDAITDQYKDIPWRFGLPVSVSFNTLNSGIWFTEKNMAVWRLKIRIPGAKSLNVNYNKFHMPEGAKFFVYSPRKKSILGAFTSFHHNPDGRFATGFIYDDEIIFEINVPLSLYDRVELEISEIIYGYRTLNDWLKNFGDAGGCNVNAICDSLQWKPELRSVVMLLTSGNARFCSGALINNTANDGKPYVLTANHCGVSTNNIFMFNYYSSQCSPSIDGNINMTIQGCTIRAASSNSDFCLVELNQTPPSSYQVIYAGWDASGRTPLEATGIHHPSGDVAKISHQVDSLQSSGYYLQGNNHWKVDNWESGTTEGGSSGSPLFDEYHLITGQLHGGNASCFATDYADYYGKFSVSWDFYADSSQQLKYWLDPSQSGKKRLIAFDPNPSVHNLNLTLLSMHGIYSTSCGNATPYIIVRNTGNQPILQAKIKFILNGWQSVTLMKNFDTLKYLATDTVHVPILNFVPGINQLEAQVIEVNSQQDYQPDNHLIRTFFYQNNPINLSLQIKTDNFGSETYWEIQSSDGTVISKGGPYEDVNGGQTFNYNLCLWEGCFRLVLKDAYGDGFCCNYGSGYLLIKQGNDTLIFNNTFNANSLTQDFCVGDSCQLFINAVIIPPAPNSGSVDLIVFGGTGNYSFLWSNGATTEDLTNVPPGVYTVIVTDRMSGCTDSATFTLGVNNIKALSTGNSDIILYPNPGDNIVNIKSQEPLEVVKIYNLHGKLLKTYHNINQNNFSIHTELPAGIYIFEVKTNTTIQTIRWMAK